MPLHGWSPPLGVPGTSSDGQPVFHASLPTAGSHDLALLGQGLADDPVMAYSPQLCDPGAVLSTSLQHFSPSNSPLTASLLGDEQPSSSGDVYGGYYLHGSSGASSLARGMGMLRGPSHLSGQRAQQASSSLGAPSGRPLMHAASTGSLDAAMLQHTQRQHRHAMAAAAAAAAAAASGEYYDPGLNASVSNDLACSVEDLLRWIAALPTAEGVVKAVGPALQHLDSSALAALMKELGRQGLGKRAVELFDYLRRSNTAEHNHLMDIYTYTTAISVCSASQQLQRALELVAEMRSRGIGCNVHTYSALMNVCIKSNEVSLAQEVYHQMVSEGCTPNLVTYNTLIDLYVKTGQWQEAIKILDTLEQEVSSCSTGP